MRKREREEKEKEKEEKRKRETSEWEASSKIKEEFSMSHSQTNLLTTSIKTDSFLELTLFEKSSLNNGTKFVVAYCFDST